MNRSALPERLTDFVGQEHLLEAISQHLRSAAGLRLVVLRGVLGSGATAVAIEYLHRTYPRHYAAAEWIGSSDSDETGRFVSRALNRFREVGGSALLVLDGVASPERLSGLLPIDGPDVLITSSADATAWAGACALNVAALTPQDAMGLLCRYEPGLPMPEAERLAARLDHSPEALTHVGRQLSRKLSARQVLDMSHAELLELLRRGGICSPTERIRAAVEALAPEWRFAQDLLRALALIGSPVFPSRDLGRLVHRAPDLMPSVDGLPVALVVEVLEVLSRRGLLHFRDDGMVELLNLPRLVSLLVVDAPARSRADRIVEALVIALDIDRGEPVHRAAAEQMAQHILALGPDRITTREGRSALVKLTRVHLRTHHHHHAVEQLSRFRAAWEGGTGEPWEAEMDRHLAQAYEGVGNPHKAFESAVRAMEAEARRLGARARLTLADGYAVARILGIYDPAVALRKAEEVEHQQAKWLGESDCETLRTGSLIARLQLRCRLPDTAADQARSVWRAQCNVLGESDQETLETLHLLGEALEATGHSARAALTCYRDARKLRRKVLGEDHPATVESTNSYVRVKASLTPFAN
ncbi:hypothetical protein [Streptomyces tubercidicus]|uniref:hypothetical protein n=1 Tax=Streptomyces tubercidicus TaxID=47759 RepID=UPI00346695AA